MKNAASRPGHEPGVRRDDNEHGDQVTRGTKIADDFAAKSADNARAKFQNPGTGLPDFHPKSEDHL
jgi:hypothetical protein